MRIFASLVIFFTFLTNSDAYEFRNFRAKGVLKQLEQAVAKKELDQNQTVDSLRKMVNSHLLSDQMGPVKISDEDRFASIFDKLMQVLGQDYNLIGNRETGPLIHNHEMGGGVVNFSGFSWQRPFANFKLYANRELAPDLYQERWIIHDTLTVVINASTMLSNMRDLDLVDISDEGLTAFAGLGFARTYHYYHFADTFLSGLTADFSKLFLSFTRFNTQGALSLPAYNIMKQEDIFSFNAGGFVTFPVWYGFGVKGGVLISKSFTSMVTLQGLGPDDRPRKDEFLRLSVESENLTSADAHLELQADFFQLLKLTLLSYDLEYSLEKSNTSYLSFFQSDRQALTGEKRDHFTELIKGNTDVIDQFRSNVVQTDQRSKENLNSKFFFLLLGSINKTATEQIKIIKDGVEKVFFKHYAESKQVIQSFWSKLWGTIIHKIFRSKPNTENESEMSKKIVLDYEFEGDVEKVEVSSADKFSLKLTQTFTAKSTSGSYGKKYYRQKAMDHLARYTMFDMSMAKLISDAKIKGPMTMVTNVLIEKSALIYFHGLAENQVKRELRQVCKEEKNCIAELEKRYKEYITKWHQTGVADLNLFKKFISEFYKRIRNNADFFLLFGVDNVFINGSIDAVTSKNQPYQNFFKSGQFRGLGVIDDFMRTGNQVVLPIETN